jgi:thiamine pyrophosphokinase
MHYHSSYQSASPNEAFEFRPDDYILCADGGYSHAREAGIAPHAVIGDFDSIAYKTIEEDLARSGLPECRILRVAAEKDDTDTLICLKYGIDQGYDEFFLIGGLGGRLDHTVANLQTMCYAAEHGKTIWILDGKNRATLREPGSLTIEAIKDHKISLFAFGEACEGVSISGVKYPLRNHRLKNDFPLGVSNEFLEKNAQVSHTAGKLLIVLSQD